MSDDELLQTIELVKDAQGGDRQAMDRLFARYLPRVRQIVALRLGFRAADLAVHEDIVQDALLNTFRNLDHYDERSEATFRHWISRCVTNSVRDHFRREHAQKRGGGKVRPLSSFEREDLSAVVFAGNDPTPSVVVGQAELLDRLEQALLDLKEHWREVIVLRLFCEMSYEEVGEAMGIREEATVRKVFSRAMAELRRRCGGE